jgi:hypothetical protein
LKQFWLRLDPKISSTDKAELLKAAETHCDVIVLDPRDISLASSLKLRTASKDDRAEIRVFR